MQSYPIWLSWRSQVYCLLLLINLLFLDRSLFIFWPYFKQACYLRAEFKDFYINEVEKKIDEIEEPKHKWTSANGAPMIANHHPSYWAVWWFLTSEFITFLVSLHIVVSMGSIARNNEVDYIDWYLHDSLMKDSPHMNSMKIRNIRKELPNPWTQ